MRVLVDTNVWVDFLRQSNEVLRELLQEGRVSTHPCVIGELFVGSLAHRGMMMEFMQGLPKVAEAEPGETLAFIENRRIWGRGLQWNDAILLASALVDGTALWTLDRRLAAAAEELGISWSP